MFYECAQKDHLSFFLDKNIMEISLTVKLNSETIPHLNIVGISTFMSVLGGITPAALLLQMNMHAYTLVLKWQARDYESTRSESYCHISR